MTYPEAIQFLYNLRLTGIKPGLAGVSRLAAMAGNPHHQLSFLHLAGTNGKGSTCAILEAIYRQSGLRVGLYTSPHLVRFGERIQVNRQLISETDVVRLLGVLQPFLSEFPLECRPTFFEMVTVMALLYFQEQRCDLVIWETGMGGRLDATNIVTPLASIITNVQFDHEKWLGATLPEIALEKAGIIKPGVPVLTATQAPDALQVLVKNAKLKNSPITIIPGGQNTFSRLAGCEPSLPGSHQRLNAALALAAVECLREKFPVSPIQAGAGLASVHWPGRLQIEQIAAGTWVFDGAHNPAGAAALIAALQELFPRQRFALLFGCLKDKNIPQIARALLPCAESVALPPVRSERSADPAEVKRAFLQAGATCPIFSCATLTEALSPLQSAKRVLVTGSLHFLGEVMETLRILPSCNSPERGLNDWKEPVR
jgi:dihydrofolate synthase / folylpolyglutamate synthase